MTGHNTLLEDIAAEIGYTATSTLVGWFGGEQIRVPLEQNPEHLIAKLIGTAAFGRLVRAFGGENIFVPRDSMRLTLQQHRVIYNLLRNGTGIDSVSAQTGLTTRQIHYIRRNFEERGILPMILKAPKEAK